MDSLNMSTEPIPSSLLLVYKSEKGHFLGIVDNQKLQGIIASMTVQSNPEEVTVDMLD
jgi:hypothetical protein